MTATDRNYSLIAMYNSLTHPGVNTDVKNIPAGRTWNITFSGGNNGVSNRDSMKIVMDVNDTMCGDAGMYRCRVVYFTATNIFQDVNATDQNVTASTGLSGIRLAADPDMNAYSVGDNVTFTCSAVGPAVNVNFRWELWADNSFGIEQSQPLPSSNEQTNNLPTPQTGNTGCALFNWVSTLRIQVPDDYEQQTYKCIVTYLQQELSSNLTIGTTGRMRDQPSNVSTNTFTSGGKFSVYCDSSRANVQHIDTVQSLSIYRMVATDSAYSLIAQYNRLTSAGVTRYFKNIPSGRLWDITFIWDNNGVNNKDTMKIVMDVNDAMSTDAGMYRCRVVYYSTAGILEVVYARDQNVKASNGVKNTAVLVLVLASVLMLV